jgi:hypothetical protein
MSLFFGDDMPAETPGHDTDADPFFSPALARDILLGAPSTREKRAPTRRKRRAADDDDNLSDEAWNNLHIGVMWQHFLYHEHKDAAEATIIGTMGFEATPARTSTDWKEARNRMLQLHKNTKHEVLVRMKVCR